MIVVTESNDSFSISFEGCSRSGWEEVAISDGVLPSVIFSCCVKSGVEAVWLSMMGPAAAGLSVVGFNDFFDSLSCRWHRKNRYWTLAPSWRRLFEASFLFLFVSHGRFFFAFAWLFQWKPASRHFDIVKKHWDLTIWVCLASVSIRTSPTSFQWPMVFTSRYAVSLTMRLTPFSHKRDQRQCSSEAMVSASCIKWISWLLIKLNFFKWVQSLVGHFSSVVWQEEGLVRQGEGLVW